MIFTGMAIEHCTGGITAATIRLKPFKGQIIGKWLSITTRNKNFIHKYRFHALRLFDYFELFIIAKLQSCY
jgi:hypothetical protein